MDCIYIDYAKAFDKVDHKVLLKKLSYYGIGSKYVRWIHSFLTNRFQTVYVNGHFSSPAPVLSGVPQGSVLGPLLFNIGLNDLSSVIENANIYTFADDTKVVAEILSVKETISLQSNLDSITKWSQENNMKLNNKKFELLIHTPKPENKNVKLLKELPFYNTHKQYHTSDLTIIEPSSFVRDLGILVDEKLNWKIHIDKLSNKCKQISAWICSVFYTRDKTTMLTLFNSLVRSKAEFCCEVWNPQKIQDIVKIEQIQRSFTYRISGMKDYNYWERLTVLKIKSLQRRREKIVLVHLWKILNNIYPNTIQIKFKPHDRTSSIKAILKPIPPSKGSSATNYEGSFEISSAKLWNILPPNLTTITSLSLFKRKLELFLANIPDQPPIPGYPYTSDNSLKNICA